jgi:hypothetical protein
MTLNTAVRRSRAPRLQPTSEAAMAAFATAPPLGKAAGALTGAARGAGWLYGEKLKKFLVSATFHCGLTERRPVGIAVGET